LLAGFGRQSIILSPVGRSATPPSYRGAPMPGPRRKLGAGGVKSILGYPSRRLFEAGRAAYRKDRFARARRLLTMRLRLKPRDRMAWLYLARAERELGDRQASLVACDRALALTPGWPPAVRHKAELLIQAGRDSDVPAVLESLERFDGLGEDDLRGIWPLLIARAPGVAAGLVEKQAEADPRLRALAAEAAARAGDTAHAAAVAERFAAGPDPADIAAAIRIYDHLGRIDDALRLVPKLEGATPEDLISVARALHARGFIQRGIELLEEAPEHPEAVRLRTRAAAQAKVLNGWRPAAAGAGFAPARGRILHIAHASLPHQLSGYTVRTHNIVKAQRAAGLDPHVVTRIGFPGGRAVDELELVDGIPYHRLRSPGAKFLDSVDRLTRSVELLEPMLAEQGPSVLHPASDYEQALVALALREATGVPVVYEVRGFWEDTWLSRQPAISAESFMYERRRAVNLRCMMEADRVVTLGETMKREIVSRGVDAQKVAVVPNAVDAEALRPTGRDRALARRLGIGSGAVVFGYIGSVLNYEGLDLLVEATAEVRRAGADVHCLVVGDGPERPRLEALANRLGISDRVSLPGPVTHDAIGAYYGLIDVYAMPRRDFRVCNLVTPIKPYEAMAAGCALVVSDVDALREIVDEEVTGLVAKADDVSALARALERLAGDPELRSTLADNASEWVRVERTWERAAAKYTELYEEVA
jgi:glycosyltransferase involved in cell wall biosynthesis